jgi:uncharacterized membrane protein
MKIALAFETLLLVGILFGVYFLKTETAEAYRLFELLGVFLAAMITTYGLYKMRDIT